MSMDQKKQTSKDTNTKAATPTQGQAKGFSFKSLFSEEYITSNTSTSGNYNNFTFYHDQIDFKNEKINEIYKKYSNNQYNTTITEYEYILRKLNDQSIIIEKLIEKVNKLEKKVKQRYKYEDEI